MPAWLAIVLLFLTGFACWLCFMIGRGIESMERNLAVQRMRKTMLERALGREKEICEKLDEVQQRIDQGARKTEHRFDPEAKT